MSLFDRIFIGCFSLALLLLILSGYGFWQWGTLKKKGRRLSQRRPKQKAKRKKWQRAKRRLEIQSKRNMKRGLLFLFLAMLLIGGASYARYYQLTNLTAQDATALAKGYYLIGEAQKQIEAVDKGSSPEKAAKNVKEIGAQLTNASIRKASTGMSVEGQRLLNRHFTMIKNLGVNLSSQTTESLNDSENRKNYLADIKKATDSEIVI